MTCTPIFNFIYKINNPPSKMRSLFKIDSRSNRITQYDHNYAK